MSQKRLITRIALLLIILFTQLKQGFSQVSISGPTCVVAGTTSLYSFSGSYTNSTNMTWCVSNGTIQQAYGSNITGTGSCRYGTPINMIAVLWSSGGTGSVTLQSSNGDASPLSVTVSNALIPGTITANATQAIAYNITPAAISCSAATYGACSPAYTYQWQKSGDNVNFTDISGQTGLNLSFSAPLIATTYYRRKVTETSTSTVAYTSSATVTVSAPFSTTAISPVVQDIFTGTVPAAMGGNAATGGSCSGAYTYQWQRSTDGGATFADISGASGLNYTPPALTATTYYRRKDGCGSQLSYNNVCVVNVYQHVTGGAISPSALTITYGTDPGVISGGSSTGGMCSGSYAYQWQSSANNVTFTDIPGKTFINHSPGILTATTYFRRKVTCATETAYSNTAAITVNPQIFPGVITLNSMAIMVNTSPGTITANAATGGTCNNNFVYQWQQSADGLDYHYTDITGATGQNYTAGTLTATTYFRRKVTCGIDVLYTNACIVTVTSAAPVYNYIQSRVITKAGVTDETAAAQLTNPMDVRQTTQYFDGLGRPVQTVSKQASPATHDIVVPNAYNEFGREVIKFLPYAAATGDGVYKATAIADQAAFYNPAGSQGTQLTNGIARILTPYAITGYEPSPLNVAIEQGAPGDAWQLPGAGDANSSGHTLRTVYTANDQVSFNTSIITNNAGSRKAAYYTAPINADGSRSLLRTGNTATYLSNELYVTITRDENWKPGDGCFGTTEEYKDKESHIVLKRTYNLNTRTGKAEQLSTYYVYDNLGNLCFVLPPGASPDNNASISQSTIDFRSYQYRYDARGRLNQKKVPSKGWEYIIYNKLDQAIATQDSVQRMKAPQEWTITKYDAMGRPVITGIYQHPGSTAGVNNLVAVQALADAVTTYWETPVATGNGYTTNAWPATITTVLSVNYYDVYTGIPLLPTLYDQHTNTAYSQQTTGLLTATKTLVLNTTADYLWTVPYYDNEGKVIRTFGQHYLGGAPALSPYNYDDVTTSYNFSDQPRNIIRRHYVTNTAKTAGVLYLTSTDSCTYDHMGRRRVSYNQLRNGLNTSQARIIVSLSSYNEIGQLMKKGLHSVNGTAFLQTVNYRYNPRGWLTNINNPTLLPDGGLTSSSTNDQFGMELKYDNTTTSRPQYNGNIATITTKTAPVPGTTSQALTYDYRYDKLNRLNDAVSSTGTASKDGLHSEYLSYNTMGDITALGRYDNVLGTRTRIDTLTYSYSGYRQTRIDDSSSYTGAWGFTDAVKQANEYLYDGNGNTLKDLNKGITGIGYNMLSLPQTITKSNGNSVAYVYDATGRKLRKISVDVASGNTMTTEYVNGIEYDNGTAAITFIQTEEGRARKTGTTYKYEYDLKDHLGDTRLTLTWAPADSVSQLTPLNLQHTEYYAFGYTIQSLQNTVPSPKNLYLYNHKELQEETGLYDYGARFYDPVIGRWTSVDPLAEKDRRWSPYNYVRNNPIRFIDPDGMYTIEGADKNVNQGNATYTKDKDGNVTWVNATEDTKRIGNAMLKNSVGTKELDAVI